MTTAQEIFTNIERQISGSEEKEIFNEYFVSSTGLENIFYKLWSYPVIRKLVTLPEPDSVINRKDDAIAAKFRNEGNRLYRDKKFDKALLAYNYSVISSIHPPREEDGTDEKELRTDDETKPSPTPECVKTSSSECLSFAYANRSALLFEMGEYKHSLADIERAFRVGYPRHKAAKLKERKGKCLLKLNEGEKAEEQFKELLETIKSESETNSESLRSIENLLGKCKLKSKSKGEEDLTKENNYRSIFSRGPETPLFVDQKLRERQKNLFYMSNDVNIQHSPGKGRHLIAGRDIEPGEILLVERAHCSVPKLNSNLRSYCYSCLRRSPVVLPCHTCSLVIFCDEECRANSRHYVECQLLPTVTALKLDAEVSLVFRTICLFTGENIASEIRKLERCRTDKKGSKCLQPSNTFENLQSLEGNIEVRTSECLQEAAVNAMIIITLLKNIPQFWCSGCDKEGVKMLGGLAMRWILSFQCNIHCLKELQLDQNVNVISSTASDVGYGIYSAFSLMNHSCVPNVLHSSWGDTKFLFSIAPICRGEEIDDSYGERYVSHNLAIRQQNLQATYHFKCTCRACEENWPTFALLPDKFNLVCNKCTNNINMATVTCERCQLSYGTEQKSSASRRRKKKKEISGTVSYDATKVQEQIKAAWSDYEDAYKRLNSYDISNLHIKKIARLITLMNKYTNIPHKPFVEAQELLLRSFDLLGSCAFVNSTS